MEEIFITQEGLDKIKAELERMDHAQLMYEAKRDGKEEGAREKQIEIAKKLLKAKVGMEVISETTGLTKEEIEKLQEM